MQKTWDLPALNRERKKWIWIETLIALAGLGAGIALMIPRLEWATILVCSLAWILIVFLWGMKVYPVTAYRKFLREQEQGLRRQVAGYVKTFGDQPSYREGVGFFELILLVNDHDRLVLVDAQKPRPVLREGQWVEMTLYGNYLVSMDAEGEKP